MRNFSICLILLFSLSLVGGCAKRNASMASNANGENGSGGANDSMRFYGSNVSSDDERNMLAKDTYYFGYDKYDITDEDTLSLYAHAKKLSSNGGHVRIEGHTDERGSREYNIALANRRANAIANVLKMKGVDPNQISVVSYGKEKPANAGHDESAWSLNRRGAVAYE